MNLKRLRKLAKSSKFQTLFRRVKESHILELFRNKYDLSKVQELFLYYLEFYEMLYRDLANKERYISEEVIANDLRADAYLLLRTKEGYKKENKENKRQVDTSGNQPSIIFKRNK
jgi:hypothetical protein